jgi:hypothetical protein
MADDVVLPGTGDTIAADEIVGKKFQRLKLTLGADGVNDGDVSAENPMPVKAIGELIEAIEAMRMAVASLTRTIGMALPNAQGFPIMEMRQGTAGNLNMTASLAGGQTLATLTTLTNQTQIGGFAANDQIPSLMHLQADGLRANIAVT